MSSIPYQILICVLVQTHQSEVVWDADASVHVSGALIGHAEGLQVKLPQPSFSTRYPSHLPNELRRLKYGDPSSNIFKHIGANTLITADNVRPYRFHSKQKLHVGHPNALYDDTNHFKKYSFVKAYDSCGMTSVKHHATQLNPNFRVVGGQTSQPQAWPWMAAVGHFRKGLANQVDFHCGGSLISKNHVLTAAHCILFPLTKAKLVRLGVVNLHDTQSAVDVRVKKTVAHFGFDWISGVNDIGVLFLSQTLSFTDSVRPICLPNSSIHGGHDANSYPFLAGWGITKDMKVSSWLQEVSLPLVPFQECQKIYADLPADRTLHIQAGQICGGYDEGGRDACQGDSGGPLMISNRDGLYYLIGIISLGDGCGQPGIPGIFTDVAYYMPWLERVLNITS